MGHRANLVLVDRGAYTVRYGHWSALDLAREVFIGPEAARRYVRSHIEGDWLDEIWAEGGVVVDFDQRVLLLYGGQSLLWDIPLRRLYLRLLAVSWEGWSVRWAHRGIRDMADHLGLPAALVISGGPQCGDEPLTAPEEIEWTRDVVSVRWRDGRLTLHPIRGQADEAAALGPALLSIAEHQPALERLDMRSFSDSFPTSGLHVDVANERALLWSASEVSHLEELVRRWAGWQLDFVEDRYEAQLEATGGALRLPVRTEETLLAKLQVIMLAETRPGDEIARDMAQQLAAEGKHVELNPEAVFPVPRGSDLAARQAAWDAAVATLSPSLR